MDENVDIGTSIHAGGEVFDDESAAGSQGQDAGWSDEWTMPVDPLLVLPVDQDRGYP